MLQSKAEGAVGDLLIVSFVYNDALRYQIRPPSAFWVSQLTLFVAAAMKCVGLCVRAARRIPADLDAGCLGHCFLKNSFADICCMTDLEFHGGEFSEPDFFIPYFF